MIQREGGGGRLPKRQPRFQLYWGMSFSDDLQCGRVAAVITEDVFKHCQKEAEAGWRDGAGARRELAALE